VGKGPLGQSGNTTRASGAIPVGKGGECSSFREQG